MLKPIFGASSSIYPPYHHISTIWRVYQPYHHESIIEVSLVDLGERYNITFMVLQYRFHSCSDNMTYIRPYIHHFHLNPTIWLNSPPIHLRLILCLYNTCSSIHLPISTLACFMNIGDLWGKSTYPTYPHLHPLVHVSWILVIYEVNQHIASGFT